MLIQTIEIRQLRCEGIIGVYAHEREAPQPLLLNVSITLDTEAAIEKDDISQTLDYDSLAGRLREHIATHEYQLLETLHAALMQEILSAHAGVLEASLSIEKPNALAQYGALVVLSGRYTRPQ
jgi:7,8-dihydroneopterin aldolase/epimerase/oxygenase